MGSFSKQKGARAEREVAGLLQPVVIEVCKALGLDREEWPRVRRNAGEQSQQGGCDLVGLSFLSPEVKHCATLSVPAWWRQTLRQAERNKRVPVLFYKLPLGHKRARGRAIMGRWIVRMLEADCDPFVSSDAVYFEDGTVEMPLLLFLDWLRSRLPHELKATCATDV